MSAAQHCSFIDWVQVGCEYDRQRAAGVTLLVCAVWISVLFVVLSIIGRSHERE